MLKYKTIIEWLNCIFSSIRVIFLLDTIELKIEKSNIDFKSMVMNMMRYLYLQYQIHSKELIQCSFIFSIGSRKIAEIIILF